MKGGEKQVRLVEKMLDKNSVGLIMGVFMGVVHAAWALMVAIGFAQVCLDFIYSLHFLNNPFQVAAFNLTTAVTLVIVTFIAGYVLGWVSTAIWNILVKKK